jgi:hypothetical protein
VSDPIPFPSPASSDDEKLARLKAKAEALAHKPEFEVKFFLAKHAADVGVSPEQLEAAVSEVRKLRRKDAQAQTDREKVEARNARRRESKEKSRASLFRRLKGLPDVQRRTEIEQWCRQWSEDTEVVAVEFIEYAREGAPLRPAISEEMAADPVNGPDLVEMILRRIRQYCVLTPEVETAGAFWSLLTFVPAEVALNAPIFTAYGPKHDAGKTQFLEVLSWMSRIRDPGQGPDIMLSPSAGIYRTMDLGPTLFVEEGQKIYQRDNVQEIFDASWSFGVFDRLRHRFRQRRRLVEIGSHRRSA